MMISRREYLGGRELIEPLTPKKEDNLLKLLGAINMFRTIYGKPMIVTSGYRPESINRAVGGAKKSKHLTCEAVDISDRNAELAIFCLNRLDILQACGLWIENPEKTPGWVHFQCVPPRSGNIVFNP
jgi:hypothetical protein